MSDPDPSAAPAPVYAQPWAIRMGFAVIVVFTLLVGLAFVDRGHRQELESVSETTAVGDTRLYVAPDPALAPAPAAVLDGQQLVPVTGAPLEVRETHTRRVGQDPDRGLTVYSLAESATPAEKTRVGADGAMLLKTGTNQFLIVRPQSK